ncbi:MAG: hypothetical protein ACQEP1_04695 [Nanobdellota archaeon]
MRRYLLLLSFVVLLAMPVLGVEQLIPFQGKVDHDGELVYDGNINVSIWSEASGGELIYDKVFYDAVKDGYFDVVLGNDTALDLNYNQYYWMDLQVNHSGSWHDIDWNGNDRRRFESLSGDTMSEDIQVSNGSFFVCDDGNCPTPSNLEVPYEGDLFIEGDLEVNGSSYLSINEMSTDEVKTSVVRAINSSGLGLYDQAGSDGIFVQEGGDVGIGTGSPSALLDVGGGTADNIDGTNDILVADDLEVDGVIYGDGSGINNIDASAITDIWVNESGDNMSGNLNVDGDVGIGTTNPSAQLDIKGSNTGIIAGGESSVVSGINAVSLGEGTEASGDYGAVALGKSTTASGDWSSTAIGGYSTSSGGRGSTAIGYETVASGSYGSTALGDSTTASGGYGSTALGRDIEASGQSSVAVGLDYSFYNVIQDNTMSVMGGDVGVGTTSPSASLDIGGGTADNIDGTNDALIADDLEVDGTVYANSFNIDESNDNWVNESGDSMSGDLNVAGNVGIGTTSPSEPLSFGTDLFGSGKLALYENGGSDIYGFGVTSGSVDFYAGGDHSASFKKPSLSYGGFYTTQGVFGGSWLEKSDPTVEAPTNGVIVEGNVGIGETSPQNKLDVRGKINASKGRAITDRIDTTTTMTQDDWYLALARYLDSEGSTMILSGSAQDMTGYPLHIHGAERLDSSTIVILATGKDGSRRNFQVNAKDSTYISQEAVVTW